MGLWDVVLDTAICLALFFPTNEKDENEEEEEDEDYESQNDFKRENRRK